MPTRRPVRRDEPAAQAVTRVFGTSAADAARGIELRHDHGSPYFTDWFQGQSRFHGFTPRFAFIGEPEINGVVERFNRTLKSKSSTAAPTATAFHWSPPSRPSSPLTISHGASRSSAIRVPAKPALLIKPPPLLAA